MPGPAASHGAGTYTEASEALFIPFVHVYLGGTDASPNNGHQN